MARSKEALLSRIEEVLLLVVWEVGSEAYGVPVRRRASRALRRPLSVGAVYVPLERMVSAGLLRAVEGDPTPVRGGRRRRYYRLTPRGLKALEQTRKVTEKLWAGKTLRNGARLCRRIPRGGIAP